MSIIESARPVALSLALAFLAGCATIVEGSDQTIAVASDPSGAACEFQREGQAIGFVNPTPGSITIKKSSEELIVSCSKGTYEDEVVSLSSQFAGMTFGNILFGGIIGVGIDAASGAMHNYPEAVTVLLAPTSFGSVEERDKFYKARRLRITADIQKAIQKIRKDCLPDERTRCAEDTKKLEAGRDLKLAEMEVKRTRAKIGSGSALASTETPSVTEPPAKVDTPTAPENKPAAAEPPAQAASRPVDTDVSTPAEPTSTSADAQIILAYWRARDGEVRKNISKQHIETSEHNWLITEFKILGATQTDNNSGAVSLNVEYGLARGQSRGVFSPLTKPHKFQRTVVVDGTKEVVSVGTLRKIGAPTSPPTRSTSPPTRSKQIASRPAEKASALSPLASQHLRYWRLRDDILRKAITKQHPLFIDPGYNSGRWSLVSFRIVSASSSDKDDKLVTLETAYTIEKSLSGAHGPPTDPINFRQTVVVNDETETVVNVGKEQRLN